MFDKLLKLSLPDLRSREEMLDILQKEEYGYMPSLPDELSFTLEENTVNNFCAGKAVLNKVTANCRINGKPFSFPFYASVPTSEGKHPFFVHINFRDNVPDIYQPTEEIIDNGFAVLSFCYKDVTSDDNDFTNGLAGVLYENGLRGERDAGKLAMWAWAAQRVLDFAYTRPDLFDLGSATVCGHSRLGKTALLTAATDERFAFAYSNDSGCSGAALSRARLGETIEVISRVFPFWFCPCYRKYADNEVNLPFDQHYLIASIAPRRVLIGSASEDEWAGPESEFLACVAASDAFDNGIVHNGVIPQAPDKLLSGDVGYHIRHGKHYFSRTDWHRLMEFVNLHI